MNWKCSRSAVEEARGSAETSQGLKLLREYKGTVKRLEFEEQIMNVLQNQKTCRTDQYMRNREAELLSVAEDGTRCVVKEWFSGASAVCRARRR